MSPVSPAFYHLMRKRTNLWIIVGYICLLMMVFLILFPLAMMISSSFKDEMEIFEYPVKLIPRNPINRSRPILYHDNPYGVIDNFTDPDSCCHACSPYVREEWFYLRFRQ